MNEHRPGKAQARKWLLQFRAFWQSYKAEGLLAVLVLVGALVYLGCTQAMYKKLAFPLDDSWIHLVIARNIARYGEFVYNVGEPTNGSTSPLWTLLLSLGYLLKVEFRVWNYGLGLFFAWLSGVVLYRLGSRYLVDDGRVAWVAAGLALIEWHIVWCGLAGMETTLFVFLSVYMLYGHLRMSERSKLVSTVSTVSPSAQHGLGTLPLGALALGGVGSLLVLTRPEGLGLLGLIALDGLVRQRMGPIRKGWRKRLQYVLSFALPFAVLIGPTVLYNIGVTGQPLPATFYAKAAEFTDPTSRTLFGFVQNWFLLLFWTVVLGPQLLLLPGIAYGVVLAVRRRRMDPVRCHLALLISGWIALLLAAYALHLPLMSHHGRYYVPLFPLLILLGVWGTWEMGRVYRRFRLLKQVYVLLVGIGFVLTWANGALVYAKDVRMIDDEWVPLSLWLRDHTPPDSLVAAHDIGALGYFAGRRILDMAGLVTPGAIPHIGNEASMRAYLQTQGVDYVVTFPLWYPEMIRDPAFELVYEGSSPYLRQSFGHNLQVYRTNWQGPDETRGQ